MVLEGPRKETIAQAQDTLGQTRAVLRLAEAQRLELKRKKEEIATRLADIAGAGQISPSSPRSLPTPKPSRPSMEWCGESRRAGRNPGAGSTVVTVGDIYRPWVRAYLSELDFGKVKLGDKVNVSTDSFPGKVYPGA